MLPARFGSDDEKWVYLALSARKLPFDYQVPELGGWVRGGTIIDFVVKVPGAKQKIALFVDGQHWHGSKNGKSASDILVRNRLWERGYDVRAMTRPEDSAGFEPALKWIKENIQ